MVESEEAQVRPPGSRGVPSIDGDGGDYLRGAVDQYFGRTGLHRDHGALRGEAAGGERGDGGEFTERDRTHRAPSVPAS